MREKLPILAPTKAIVADSSYANLNLMINSLYRQFFFLKYPFTFLTKLLARLILKVDTSTISPETAIKHLKTPILLIHGEKDSQIPVENAHLLKKANPNAELWVLKNADHGQAHFVEEKEYEKRVLDFFDVSEIIPLVSETSGQSPLSRLEGGMISEHVKNHPIRGGVNKICHPPQRVVFNEHLK